MYETTIKESALKYAEDYLGETSELRDKCVNEIKVWLESEKTQFTARNDYVWILSFLRVCKFDIERTKCKISTHLKLRATTPEWFSNRDPFLPELQELLDIGVFLPLRKYDKEGRLVVIVRAGAHDPLKSTQNDVFKVCKMILDVAMQKMEEATIYGVVAIIDMQDITLRHAMQLTPTIIKKAVTAWENYYFKPKSINFIYSPSYINVVLNIFKQFMSKKLKKRVHVYGTSHNAEEIVPKEILPKEYGGDDGDLQQLKTYWKKECEYSKDWFREDEQFKAIIY